MRCHSPVICYSDFNTKTWSILADITVATFLYIRRKQHKLKCSPNNTTEQLFSWTM